MLTPGDDPVYAAARTVLMDALDVLRPHLASITLVGAQAIYLRTGEGDIAVAPTTTDADLALDPGSLGIDPAIDALLRGAGFAVQLRGGGSQPGIWEKRLSSGHHVTVDLLVAQGVTGKGSRRSAVLEGHARESARRVKGIEGAHVDADLFQIVSPDGRSCELRVAGPAAMLVAKTYKISERTERPDRLKDKDALDVWRILRGTSLEDLATRTRKLLDDERSMGITRDALPQMESLFGKPGAAGMEMAVRAVGPLADPVEVAVSLEALTMEYLDAVGRF